MQIRERLDEIATELGAPRRAARTAMQTWIKSVEEHCSARPLSLREMQLIEEMRRLQRDYEIAEARTTVSIPRVPSSD